MLCFEACGSGPSQTEETLCPIRRAFFLSGWIQTGDAYGLLILDLQFHGHKTTVRYLLFIMAQPHRGFTDNVIGFPSHDLVFIVIFVSIISILEQ